MGESISNAVARITSAVSGALVAAGLKREDKVFVHTSLSGLSFRLMAAGERQDIVGLSAQILCDALIEVIGKSGTLAAPAFFYDFARFGTGFNWKSSPPDRSVGEFPRYLLSLEGMKRSLCPPVSVVAVGENSGDIIPQQSAYGFGALSPWQLMSDEGTKILFWDCSPEFMTFVHHVECLAGVPHLYNKIYNSEVIGPEGVFNGNVFSSVRYLDNRYAVIYDLGHFINDAKTARKIETHQLDGHTIYLCSMSEIAAFLLKRLASDPYYLLSSPPNFVEGEVPFDGYVGKPSAALQARIAR